MKYLARKHLREQLATAEAARLAGAVQKDYQDWHRELTLRLTPRLPDME